ILFWVDKDLRERENQAREKWNTLVFFTGPVGLGIYLSKQGKTVYRCPKCGKKLKEMKIAVCPHCNERLASDVAANVFYEQMREFDESKFRVMGKNADALNVI